MYLSREEKQRLALVAFMAVGGFWTLLVAYIGYTHLAPYFGSFLFALRNISGGALPWFYEFLYWAALSLPGIILLILSYKLMRSLEE